MPGPAQNKFLQLTERERERPVFINYRQELCPVYGEEKAPPDKAAC